MIILEKLFKASIGQKFLVALTGAGLGFFLLGHMAGNLSMWIGQDAMNSYAAGLKSLGGLLWVARGGLLVMLLLHVSLAIKLTAANKRARPEKYRFSNTVKANMPSRTMIYTGMLILVFLVYHLMHYTLGIVHSEYFTLTDHMQRHDVYTMVVRSFSRIEISIAYIITMIVVAAHLSHGISSLFQSLGAVKAGSYGALKKLSIGFTLLVVLGLISVPIGVLANIIK